MQTLIIGDRSKFAIESCMTRVYARLSFRALGFFVIHIGGCRYGVCSPDATMLACSFGEVENRIAKRGSHVVPCATSPDAGEIADAFRDAIYASNQYSKQFVGMQQPKLRDLIYSNRLYWAPDGDEAFDDGSCVLHFDVEDRVRLIAFKNSKEGYHHDPETLRDLWLEANEFYRILENWRDAFESEWMAAPKISEDDDGAEST